MVATKPIDFPGPFEKLLEAATSELTRLGQKEVLLMKEKIELTQQATEQLPDKITKNEFLTFKLPPIVYYERPDKTSGTSRANPRIPKSVSLWADFTANASQFLFEDDSATLVSRPAFTNYEEPVMSEKGVDSAVMTNIGKCSYEVLERDWV